MHRRSTSKMILASLASAILAYAQRSQAPTGGSLIRNVIRILFDLAGFALLTIAGFELSSLAGFIVAGLSCFLLARHWGTADKTATQTDPLIR